MSFNMYSYLYQYKAYKIYCYSIELFLFYDFSGPVPPDPLDSSVTLLGSQVF